MSLLADLPRRRQVARVVTETTAPAPTALLLLLAVAWQSAPTRTAGLVWGLVAALFASVLPFAYILRGVRRGEWSDHHVGIREHRRLPLLFGLVSVLAGLGLLAVGQAPRELFALVAAMVVGLGSTLLVTLRWKISIHTAVVSGAVVIIALVFGPYSLLLWPAVALVGWSRVELDDHSPGQVAMGALLGAAVAGVVFTTLI